MKHRITLLPILTIALLLFVLSLPAFALTIVNEPLTGGVTFSAAANPFGFAENLGAPNQFSDSALIGGLASYDIDVLNPIGDTELSVDLNTIIDGSADFFFFFGLMPIFAEDDISFGDGLFPTMLFTDAQLTGFDFFSFDYFFDGAFFEVVVSGIDWFISDLDGVYVDPFTTIAQGVFFLPDGQIPQDVAPVPEPSTLILLGLGLGGLAYLRRRQRS